MAVITTDQAEELNDEGISILDVRTPEEFSDGHIPGALNIPVALKQEQGMIPNQDFVTVVEQHLQKDKPLVVYCKAGGRSARATAQLQSAGFIEVLDMNAGWEGGRDPFGEPLLGWSAEGREVETDALPEQLYETLK